MKLSSLVIVIAVLAMFCNPLHAIQKTATESNASSEMQLKTERVFVFKDGYFLVVKTGTVTTDANGEAFTFEVPDSAVLGSFWTTSSDGTIQSMKAGWAQEETDETRSVVCKTTIEVIKANEGKECSFSIDDNTRLSGVIGSVLVSELKVAQPVPATSTRLHGQFASPSIRSSFVTSLVGEQFVLKTDEGDVLVRANQVNQLLIKDMVTTIEQNTTVEKKRKRLTIKFKEGDSKRQVTMIYFRPGFRWIPSYRIDLAQSQPDGSSRKESSSATEQPETVKKLARIIMQGELINEAEDLIDMPIDVVVGVPNFRFKNTPSPMVLESVMINALAGASPQLSNLQVSNNQFSNAIYSQGGSDFQSGRAQNGVAGADVTLPEGLSGEGGNDLFVYHLPRMTLKKGERATVPIMEAEVPYRDVYTWNVHVKHSEAYSESAGPAASPLQLSENKVWRQVDLINDTEIPWTTGAAMFVDGFQPLAQELLTYTSPGSICRVPVTVSVDMRGRVVDSEKSRKPKNMTWNGYNYARITGSKELELANNKLESVPVEIKLTFGGRGDKASDDGEIRLSSYSQNDWEHHSGYNTINNSTSVSWTTTIEPGQCFKPTVDYHFFLRH